MVHSLIEGGSGAQDTRDPPQYWYLGEVTEEECREACANQVS